MPDLPVLPAFSLLIPVYNWPIAPLLESLKNAQDLYLGQVQILVWDDASVPEYQNQNRLDALKYGIEYQQAEANIGRSAIRNLLARNARYENLIFLDCDSTIADTYFFDNYARLIHIHSVLIGGTCYEPRASAHDKRLRHHYGRHREELSAAQRNQRFYQGFSINNMAIKANLYKQIGLDETIREYGHEDTLFGFELQKNNIIPFHIDNPVFHTGLDDNTVFLDKSLQAIKNLIWLHQTHPELPKSKLIKLANYLNKIKIDGLIAWFVNLFLPIIEYNLCSARPQLWLFDVWKLGKLIGLRING